MAIDSVSTANAPAAIGPYSQAVAAGGFLFVSGQIPIDPATGAVVAGDIRAQTRQVLANLKAILGARGLTPDRVVKTEVFLADMNDFAAMNEVYADCFCGPVRPARQAVEAARLPRDVRVEISCIACLDGAEG